MSDDEKLKQNIEQVKALHAEWLADKAVAGLHIPNTDPTITDVDPTKVTKKHLPTEITFNNKENFIQLPDGTTNKHRLRIMGVKSITVKPSNSHTQAYNIDEITDVYRNSINETNNKVFIIDTQKWVRGVIQLYKVTTKEMFDQIWGYCEHRGLIDQISNPPLIPYNKSNKTTPLTITPAMSDCLTKTLMKKSPPQIKIINKIDPKEAAKLMTDPTSEEAITNTIKNIHKANPAQIQELLSGSWKNETDTDTKFQKEMSNEQLTALGVMSVDVTTNNVTHGFPLTYVKKLIWEQDTDYNDNAQGTIWLNHLGRKRCDCSAATGLVRLKLSHKSFKNLPQNAKEQTIHTDKISKAFNQGVPGYKQKPLQLEVGGLSSEAYGVKGVYLLNKATDTKGSVFQIGEVNGLRFNKAPNNTGSFDTTVEAQSGGLHSTYYGQLYLMVTPYVYQGVPKQDKWQYKINSQCTTNEVPVWPKQQEGPALDLTTSQPPDNWEMTGNGWRQRTTSKPPKLHTTERFTETDEYLRKLNVVSITVKSTKDKRTFNVPIHHITDVMSDKARTKPLVGTVHLNVLGACHGDYPSEVTGLEGELEYIYATPGEHKENLMWPPPDPHKTIFQPPIKDNSYNIEDLEADAPRHKLSDIVESAVTGGTLIHPFSFIDQVQSTIEQRQKLYASPSDNHELTRILYDAWLEYRQEHAPQKTRQTPEDICVFNVIQKLARLGNGTHDDSWLDVIGYSENVAMLKKEQRNNK